jgi:beta-lysine 5,6-aminomutase alpha subunit
LMKAIESASFADVSRTPDGGRGVEGVFERSGDYYNPFEEALGHPERSAVGAVSEA